MVRAVALTLLCALSLPLAAAPSLCAFPGRDGSPPGQGLINLWLAGADDSELAAGSRWLPVAESRGQGTLGAGDLVLLVQMQGADMVASNDPGYGALREAPPQAGQFELLRVEEVVPGRIRVRGDGPDGGIRHRYLNREPRQAGDPGRARWQLVRVPQYESLALQSDVRALPWDGRTGAVVALDVRTTLQLNGQAVRAAGSGFRGGGALTLLGALGDERDYRYPAPDVAELAAGYGQHASKGEGIAGTPRWLAARPSPGGASGSDGYPHGSMARGAAANAGGGATSLSADNRRPAGGGGGGGGEAGNPGLDRDGAPRGGLGGHGMASDWLRLLAGGGGGAGSRSEGQGEAGQGGAGGGIVLVQAGRLAGSGQVDVRGAAAPAAGEGGGGGGGGGTVLVLVAMADGAPRQWLLDGGAGGPGAAPGGAGGRGRLMLSGAGLDADVPHARPAVDGMAGVAPGFRCRPTGMLVAGQVFEDNGGQDGVAHDGRYQRGESGLAGVDIRVREGDQLHARTRTNALGLFALELPETLAGRELSLEAALPPGWHAVAARSEDLPLAPFRWRGHGRWQFTAQREYLQDGIALGLVREPGWQVPAVTPAVPGSTRLYLFRYLPHTPGRVRFHYHGELAGMAQRDGGGQWRHRLLLDPACRGESLFLDQDTSRWLPVIPDQPVCVRVRVDVPADTPAQASLRVRVRAETDIGDTPLTLQLAPVETELVIPLAP